MNFEQVKNEFIDTWAQLGPRWGINKTMAQIHALLLTTSSPLTTDDIMEELQISRGNVNMNVRDLMDWGLVQKSFQRGSRKEYFSAIKEMPEIARCIMIQRRKKELEPLLQFTSKWKDQDFWEDESEETGDFKQTISDIHRFAEQSYELSEKLLNAEEYWLVKTLKKWL